MNETENILLMFLSTINLKSAPTYYGISANPKGEVTKTTNESAIRYILYKECRGDAKLNKIFIFASNTVRNEFVGDSGKTHLQYFKDRIAEFIPNVDDCINAETIYNYDENSSGVQNMIAVAEMAERIQKYSVGKNVTLHVDLTGGMRNVNMMMLDIIRFLEYNGIKIGRLIYSQYQPRENVGYIHEIKNIYDLLQLISGVEEFINFGSVKVLQEYYKNQTENISANLQNLLDAMKNFAEAIKLCRYGQFKNSVEKLHDAINDFSADENDLNDILMARLIEKIKQQYENLIATRGQDDIKIIRWCIEKGYLQQALTLYTERIPEYVGENFISITEEEEEKLLRAMKNDVRNKNFYLLVNYLSESAEFLSYRGELQNKISNANTKYFYLVKNDAMKNIRSGNFDYKTFSEKLFDEMKLLTDLFNVENFFDESKFHSRLNALNELKQKFIDISSPRLDAFRKIINKLNLNPSESSDKLTKIFLNNLSQMTMNDFKEIFPTFEVEIKILRLQFMLEKKIFLLNIDRKIFLSIMDKYFRLKDERNHSNHARNDIGEFETAQDLENFMLEGLNEIEKILEE